MSKIHVLYVGNDDWTTKYSIPDNIEFEVYESDESEPSTNRPARKLMDLVILELQKKAGKKVPQIELQTGRQSVKLALRDIWFVESEKNYLLFYREKDTREPAGSP